MLRANFLIAVLLLLGTVPRTQAEPPGDRAAWAETIVHLGSGRDSALQQEQGLYRGLLARELARQALLLSAREDFSCTTRDSHLGENLPTAGNVLPLDVVAIAGQPSRLDVFRGQAAMKELVAKEELKIGSQVDLAALVIDLESLSRGPFQKMLREAGLKDRPRPWDESVRIPEELSFRLNELSVVSQWYSARAIHDAISRKGVSTELLAALARTYAHLAVLTELDWSAAHDVFAARALLYAQRLVASERNPREALACRAYVLALVGLYKAALDDLAALAKLDPSNNPDDAARMKMVDAYCHFRLKDLDPETVGPEHRELVRLLRCLAREQSGSPFQTVEEGLIARKIMPHCDRIQAGLNWLADIGLTQYSKVDGEDSAASTLYPRLIALADLPDDARAWSRTAIARPPGTSPDDPGFDPQHELPARAKVISALAAAGPTVDEPRELSWPVLAHLILDHSFQGIWRRAYLDKRRFVIPADPWLQMARPLYEMHSWAPLLDSYRNDPAVYKVAVAKLRELDLDTLEMQAEEPLREPFRAFPGGHERMNQAWLTALSHADYTANDCARLIERLSHAAPKAEAPILLGLSPHSPLARSAMIAHRWDLVEPQLDKWLQEAKDDPGVLAAFGRRFLQLKQFAKATEVLQDLVAQAPSLDNYRMLAESHRAQGNKEQFEQTLEALFNSPAAVGPIHMREEIATSYMRNHQWEAAKICSQKAADRGEEWGQLALANCCEALQEWREAESLHRANDQAHGTLDWYYFTLRTGKGNKEAASKAARQLIEGSLAGQLDTSKHALYAYVNGKLNDSLRGYEAEFAEQPNPYYGLHVALLADELKDEGKRDAALKRVIEEGPRYRRRMTGEGRPELIALAGLIAKDLAAGGKGEIDLTAAADARKTADGADQMNFSYFLGRYLKLHGQTEKAKVQWLECMKYIVVRDIGRTLAGMQLLELDTPPEQYKDLLLSPIEGPR